MKDKTKEYSIQYKSIRRVDGVYTKNHCIVSAKTAKDAIEQLEYLNNYSFALEITSIKRI